LQAYDGLPNVPFARNLQQSITMILQRISLLTLFLLALNSYCTYGQGLENIIVERYYQTNEADAANALDQGAITNLEVGTIAYRIYVDMAPDYKFSNLYGNANHPLSVSTTTNFFNDPNYGVSVNPGTISANNIKKHTAMIDSWFTTGGFGGSKVGVLESEDFDGTVGNNQGILANDPGGCFGLPLTGLNGLDGGVPFDAATYVVPNTLGLGAALDPFEQTEGNSILINNGTIAALGGVVGPTASNRVLIGQFTTSGDLSFALNIQLVHIPSGSAENYVSSNPSGAEFTHPSLTYSPNTSPNVQITFPINNSTLTIGDSYTLTANADDNVNVSQVEFWIDGNLIGTSTTQPFGISYTATSGSHEMYVIATDNECASTTSSVTTFNVTNNLAPTISISAPTVAVVDETITINATAMDSDGSITQVAFYINDILLGIDTSFPYSIMHVATGGLNQMINAIATDNVGAIAISNSILLNVNTNLAPTITISAPTSTIAGETITITAEATDIDGTISLVSFYWNNTLIGSDNIPPFALDYVPSVGNNQVIYAVATDNLDAETISNEIAIDVIANIAPSLSIISPLTGDLYIFPAEVSIVAEATDTDGNIAFVDFYIDGELFNTLYASPFEINWPSSPGVYLISVIATDNLGLSSPLEIVEIEIADPNALPYLVSDLEQSCDESFYCATLQVNPALPVSNVIGYDITLLYDETKLMPSGNTTVYSDLTNAQFVEVALTNTAPGELQITINFNGQSTEFTSFNGYGDLICVEFERLADFYAIDATEIQIPLLEESYISGVEAKGVEAGNLSSVLQTEYASQIVFWQNQSPLQFDPSNPSAFVITDVVGYENNMPMNQDAPVSPNLLGTFEHDLANGMQISISREIPNDLSVQVLINAADAVIAKSLIADELSTPSVYELMAMDVNLDGVVSAGDITQLKLRATLAIGEFQQAWNYDDEGNSNGQASKDWIFVDQTRIGNLPEYTVSSQFPGDDGQGYSKTRVPQVPFILDATVIGYDDDATICPEVMFETYQAILLGDIDGSFANYSADGILRTNQEYILVDLENAEEINGQWQVPVTVKSPDRIRSVDFALTWDQELAPYVSYQNIQSLQSNCTMRQEDQTLRYSGFRSDEIQNSTICHINLAAQGSKIPKSLFTPTLGLINGKRVNIEFSAPKESTHQWHIWPNPSIEHVNMITEKPCSIVLKNITGQIVSEPTFIQAHTSVKIDVSALTSGLYFILMNFGEYTATEKLIISK
jgi:Bacterial Ig domain/Secretion system C-terminal sorting domain